MPPITPKMAMPVGPVLGKRRSILKDGNPPGGGASWRSGRSFTLCGHIAATFATSLCSSAATHANVHRALVTFLSQNRTRTSSQLYRSPLTLIPSPKPLFRVSVMLALLAPVGAPWPSGCGPGTTTRQFLLHHCLPPTANLGKPVVHTCTSVLCSWGLETR